MSDYCQMCGQFHPLTTGGCMAAQNTYRSTLAKAAPIVIDLPPCPRCAALDRELAEARKALSHQYTLRATYADTVETALRRAEEAEAALAAERIENTHLREAFVTMEKAYNASEAALKVSRARRQKAEAALEADHDQ